MVDFGESSDVVDIKLIDDGEFHLSGECKPGGPAGGGVGKHCWVERGWRRCRTELEDGADDVGENGLG